MFRTTMIALGVLATAVIAQEKPAAPAGVPLLTQQAEAIRPLVQTELARHFLNAAEALPRVEPRTLYFNREHRSWRTAAQWSALDDAARAGYEERPVDEDRYYQTRYGSPVVYARVLELAAKHGAPANFAGARVLDYGCGTIGHLRMMASLGADAVGLDVDPFLAALYSEAGDTGAIAHPVPGSPAGRVSVVTGYWPAGPGIAEQVGRGYDLFTSKNTLKSGYVHPTRPVDPRLLVDLGVSDSYYLRVVHGALKPGGLAIIYNLCPAPSKEGEPYRHWAEGRSPFPREMWEAAGFEVLAFDESDDAAARQIFEALGYPTKAEDGAEDLFAWYTVARRPR